MTSLGNLLLSRSGTDRDGERRTEPELLESLWADPTARVLRVRADGSAPLVPVEGGVRLALVEPRRIAPVPPEDVPVVYLGRSDDGTSYVAVEVAEEVEVADGAGWPLAADGAEGTRWAGLREVVGDLDDTGAGLLVEAVGILNWHRVHTHCPRCGARTAITSAGWTRRCPVDGSEHYPRTDPAVIMSVVDAEDRILLAHNAQWPENRYSTLAGFVEPGEPLEAAVRREVGEETGVEVGEVVYRGSQPWPFPASLMLGFTAHATSTQIRVDGEEIADARWFSREELAEGVRREDVLLPPSSSIARRLVEHWYGQPLPARGTWR